MEGSDADRRLSGAFSSEGERSQVKGIDRRWREMMTVEGEGWQVEGSDLRLRRAIAG